LLKKEVGSSVIKGTSVYVRGGNESFRSKELTAGIYPNPLYDLQRDPSKQHATSHCCGLQIAAISSHHSMILAEKLQYTFP